MTAAEGFWQIRDHEKNLPIAARRFRFISGDDAFILKA